MNSQPASPTAAPPPQSSCGFAAEQALIDALEMQEAALEAKVEQYLGILVSNSDNFADYIEKFELDLSTLLEVFKHVKQARFGNAEAMQAAKEAIVRSVLQFAEQLEGEVTELAIRDGLLS